MIINDMIKNPFLFHQAEEEVDSDSVTDTATDDAASTTSVDVQTLCVADKVKRQSMVHYPPVCGDTEERCKQALQHIAQVKSIFIPTVSKLMSGGRC